MGACKINTGSVLVLSALSSVFLVVTEKHVLVMIIHCLTLRRLMSYIYGAPIFYVSRSHTTTQHSR